MKNKKIDNILKLLAEKEGVPVAYIRTEIQKAIDIGMTSSDPNARAYWNSISCSGKRPTPDEVICYLIKEIKRNR